MKFPLPSAHPTELTSAIQKLVEARMCILPDKVIAQDIPTREGLNTARQRAQDLLHRMIGLQEELDWQVYSFYGLTGESLTLPIEQVPPIALGQRAFEIIMARKMASGELETSWFERHRSVPLTDIPSDLPEEYQRLIERRISAIESDRDIALVEQPEYKRRWNLEPWEDQERRAVRKWLLDRMENARYWSTLELTSCARLADSLRSDTDFVQVAEIYCGRPDFNWTALVMDLVEAESVPFLAVLRYTDSGSRKHMVWERTWESQRKEDRIDDEIQADTSIPESSKTGAAKKRKIDEVGTIPVAPRYEPKDFRRSSYWSLRGKLDVPKERFMAFPFCERDVDPTPVIAWAGWDHLQQAQAIAAYYERVKNQEGWTPERRVPLLTGILELIPWLKQWHNDIHPEYKERMGTFFQQFVEDEARAMEMTMDQIRGWTPPAQSSSRGRKKRNT